MTLPSFTGSTKFSYAAVFIGWWCLWTPMQISMLQYFDVARNIAITDAFASTILLAAFCAFVMNNMRYYLPKKEKYLYVLFMSFALSAVWMAIISIFLKNYYRNNIDYVQFFQRTAVMRYLVSFLVIACNTLVSLVWHLQKEQEEEQERRADTESLARDAELNKLRQQLQPHFLFNSLNSISALTGQQPEKARHMIQQLSDFLRGTLRNEDQQWVTLRDEINYLQLYLDIEKVRFGYRLQSQVHCEAAAEQILLPSMLLQPLVENAIKFGLYDTIGEVAIVIDAKRVNGMLEVTVQNPYDETTSLPRKGTGFGIASIRRRLYLLYGRHDLLLVQKTTTLFVVKVILPAKSAEPVNRAAGE